MAESKKEKDILDDLMEQNVLNMEFDALPTGIRIFDTFIFGEKDVLYMEDADLKFGFLKGKMYIMSGDSGVGKSTLMYECCKRWCARYNSKIIYIDAETGISKKSLIDYGLIEFAAYDEKIEDKSLSEKEKNIIKRKCYYDFIKGKKPFLPINPKYFGRTMKTCRDLVWLNKEKGKGGSIDVIIIDSLKALRPEAFNEEEQQYIEKQPIAAMARAKEGFLPNFKNFISCNQILNINLQQLRNKSGPKGSFYLGESLTQAEKHYHDARYLVKEYKKIMRKTIDNLGETIDKQDGNWINIKVTKGRTGNAFTEFKLPLLFGKGVSMVYYYLEILNQNGYIIKNGAWYTIKIDELKIEEKYQGEEGGVKIVKENFNAIEVFLYEKELIQIEAHKNAIQEPENKKEINDEIDSILNGDNGDNDIVDILKKENPLLK